MMGTSQDPTQDSGEEARSVTDPESFAVQFRRAYPRLRLIAVGIIGDATHAEDIVQDAAVIAWQKLDQFQPGSSFAAWLAEIVRRCSLNYARKTVKRGTIAADPSLLAQTSLAPDARNNTPIAADTGEVISNQTEFDDQVLAALGELTEQARCCLLLRTVQDLSYAEISELMQIPQGTAMSHVHRSKKILRRRLDQTFSDVAPATRKS